MPVQGPRGSCTGVFYVIGSQEQNFIILPAFYHRRKSAIGRAAPPVIPAAEEVSSDKKL